MAKNNSPKRGRRGPIRYEPDKHPEIARALTLSGHIDTEIMVLLGVSNGTFYNWRKKYQEFADALDMGKAVVDQKVENALLKSALGFEYEETEVHGVQDDEGNVTGRRIKRTKKAVKPDVVACIFWLKNRKPSEWRDVQQRELSGAIGVGTLDDAVRAILEREEGSAPAEA